MPLVADLDPLVPEGDGGMAVEESGVASQARAETSIGTYSVPQLALTEPTKDKVVTTVTTPLPGPR